MESQGKKTYYSCRQRGQAAIEVLLVTAVVAAMTLSMFTIFGNPIKDVLLDSEEFVKEMVAGTEIADVGVVGADVKQLPQGWYRDVPLPQAAGRPPGELPQGEIDQKEIEQKDIPQGNIPQRDIPQRQISQRQTPDNLRITGGDVGGDGRGGPEGPGAGGGVAGGAGPGGTGDGGGAGFTQRRGQQDGATGSGAAATLEEEKGKKRADAPIPTLKPGEEEDYVIVFNEETGEYEKRLKSSLGEDAEADEEGEGKRAKGAREVADESSDPFSSEFDWMTALKMVILLLLLVFIFYIAIGSTRRGRDE